MKTITDRLHIHSLKDLLNAAPLLFLAAVTVWYRLVNLGYSNYQGDEISALPASGLAEGLMSFLLGQRKGPVQFLTTLLVEQVNPGFRSEMLTRLPFALAGILAVYFFYKLVAFQFDKKIALYASLLLTTNGLIVGLTRIAQYQSLVMLFSVTALYAFSLAQKVEAWRVKGIYIGMLLWAAGILSHYDGIFIAPLAAIILWRWWMDDNGLARREKLKHAAAAGLGVGLLMLLFYLPLFFSASEDTQAYWSYRLTAKESKSGISSSVVTFRLYNTLWVFAIYALLAQLALFKLKDALPALVWFLFPWQVMELVIFDPGTHIYTYLMPGAILLAYGLLAVEEGLHRAAGARLGKALTAAGLGLLFVFLASLSHFLFIDNTPEYPWQERRLLFWTVAKPETKGDLWVFGFSYNRRWDEIGEFVARGESAYYATNDKIEIADFYTGKSFDVDKAGYYIHVYHPQTFKDEIAKDKIRYWKSKYEPVKIFRDERGTVLAEIYEMPVGTLEEITAAGY